MSASPVVLKPGDRSHQLNVVGVQMWILSSGADGQPQVTLQTGQEGMGPPPHHHAWDESFYIMRGAVQFNCAGQSTLCPAGTFVYIPPNTTHGFAFAAGGGEMLEFTGEGSKAVQLFQAINDELPPGPPDPVAMVKLLRANGLEVDLG